METSAHDDDASCIGEPLTVLGLDGARDEDAHWERAHSREHYFKPGLDYEDYAPAYCVGYIGHAQYGGRFEDAERSLCANWERIKGDSRLSLDDALLAMRAAWDRMDGHARRAQMPARPSMIVGLIRRYLRNPSFKPGLRLMR
jgi:hypothetical protein